MKKLLLLIVLLFPLTAFAQVTIQPIRIPILAQLQMFWTVLCEDVWGGEYKYDQLESGPTEWYCEGGTPPDRDK